MTENEIAKRVLDAAFVIHRELGPGLLETVYEVVLAKKLTDMGLFVERLASIHGKQLLTYLRLSGCRLGLLTDVTHGRKSCLYSSETGASKLAVTRALKLEVCFACQSEL